MATINLTMRMEEVAGYIARFQEQVSPAWAGKIAAMTGYTRIREYLMDVVSRRHSSAQRLSATPSGFWAGASEQVRLNLAADGGEIVIEHPGIRRAVSDVVIRPKRAKALTIPLHAMSYGKRVGEVERLLGEKLVRPKGARLLARKEGDGKLTPMYLLTAQAFQKQDPTLLPSEQEMGEAMMEAFEIQLAVLAQRMK